MIPVAWNSSGSLCPPLAVIKVVPNAKLLVREQQHTGSDSLRQTPALRVTDEYVSWHRGRHWDIVDGELTVSQHWETVWISHCFDWMVCSMTDWLTDCKDYQSTENLEQLTWKYICVEDPEPRSCSCSSCQTCLPSPEGHWLQPEQTSLKRTGKVLECAAYKPGASLQKYDPTACPIFKDRKNPIVLLQKQFLNSCLKNRIPRLVFLSSLYSFLSKLLKTCRLTLKVFSHNSSADFHVFIISKFLNGW